MFLKNQHQLVVQFHEQYFTNATQFMSVKCLKTAKVEGKQKCTLKISLFPNFLQRSNFSLTRSEIP